MTISLNQTCVSLIDAAFAKTPPLFAVWPPEGYPLLPLLALLLDARCSRSVHRVRLDKWAIHHCGSSHLYAPRYVDAGAHHDVTSAFHPLVSIAVGMKRLEFAGFERCCASRAQGSG